MTGLTIAINFASVNNDCLGEIVNASDVHRILGFLVPRSNHGFNAPVLQKGVQVILKGKEVSMVAVTTGCTTIVHLKPQSSYGGQGSFFMDHDDLMAIYTPLKSSGNEKVVFEASEQPLVKGVKCLKTSIGGWFEGSLGKAVIGPKRSREKSQDVSRQVKAEVTQISTICAKPGVKVETESGLTKIQVLYPPPGVKSILVELY